MYIDGEEIKLDPEKQSVAVEEDDWAIDCASHLMRHMPTKVTFRIEMDEEAQKAITQLNEHQMGGRSLTVNEARPKPEYSGGGGGYGGGDSGRRRSEPRW